MPLNKETKAKQNLYASISWEPILLEFFMFNTSTENAHIDCHMFVISKDYITEAETLF